MRNLLLLLCLVALPSWGATLSSTTCTSSVRTGCAVLDVATLNQLPSTVGVQLSGTWTGAVQFEGSLNGATYVAVTARPSSGGVWVSSADANGVWAADVAGMLYFRVRASALTSGSITVHMTPSTARPVVDVVRAVGSDFGYVHIAGTTSLDTESVAALAAPVCNVVTAPPVVSLSTSPTTVDPSPMGNRTQIIIRNLSGNQQVWCCAGTDCTPSQTGAYVLLPNGDYHSFPVRATRPIRCRSAAATASVNVLEAACG